MKKSIFKICSASLVYWLILHESHRSIILRLEFWNPQSSGNQKLFSYVWHLNSRGSTWHFLVFYLIKYENSAHLITRSCLRSHLHCPTSNMRCSHTYGLCLPSKSQNFCIPQHFWFQTWSRLYWRSEANLLCKGKDNMVGSHWTFWIQTAWVQIPTPPPAPSPLRPGEPFASVSSSATWEYWKKLLHRAFKRTKWDYACKMLSPMTST